MVDLIYLGLKKIVFSAHKSFATVPLSSALSVHVPRKKCAETGKSPKMGPKKAKSANINSFYWQKKRPETLLVPRVPRVFVKTLAGYVQVSPSPGCVTLCLIVHRGEGEVAALPRRHHILRGHTGQVDHGPGHRAPEPGGRGSYPLAPGTAGSSPLEVGLAVIVSHGDGEPVAAHAGVVCHGQAVDTRTCNGEG